MSTCLTIRPISYCEILSATNSSDLVSAYAAECSVPDADPQVEKYKALEQQGVIQCFGAYLRLDHPLDPPTLIGFASVLISPMLHNSKSVGTVESIFVLSQHRKSGAGNALLCACERYIEESQSIALVYNARIGSALEKVLRRRADCIPTHTVFTRWL